MSNVTMIQALPGYRVIFAGITTAGKYWSYEDDVIAWAIADGVAVPVGVRFTAEVYRDWAVVHVDDYGHHRGSLTGPGGEYYDERTWFAHTFPGADIPDRLWTSEEWQAHHRAARAVREEVA